jgi:hypothetical protein
MKLFDDNMDARLNTYYMAWHIEPSTCARGSTSDGIALRTIPVIMLLEPLINDFTIAV